MIDSTTMKQLDYEYYEWLTSQIEVNSSRTYSDLFGRMHDLEFVWTVPNDDNRVQDGLDLRNEFLNELPRVSRRDVTNFNSRLIRGATILEVLIGLSRRVAFNAGGTPEFWAWKLIENLQLSKMSDPFTKQKEARVEDILEALIWRTYQRDGTGGFFPLNWADKDQTKVEIWYQMQKYVMEIVEP